ncbi:hypothetical protein Bca4012_029604 [Brassica carinata]
MVNFLWTIRTCPHDGHQGFGQRVMDGRTMMDIKVMNREKRQNGAMAVRKRVRFFRLKMTTSRLQSRPWRDGERRSWTETKRRPMEELRRG